MATIARLNVGLTADTQAFKKGMVDAQSILNSFTVGIGVGLERVAEFGLGLAKDGVSKLAEFVHTSMESIDTTAKLADRIGTTTEELIGLQHAAKLDNVEVETLNRALDTFTKRVGGVTDETGGAADAINSLGLNIELLKSQDPVTSFLQIAEKVKALNTQTEKASVVTQIYGSKMISLLNLLDKGPDEIKSIMKEAEQLGMTFNRFDAGKVEAVNDNFTRLEGVLTGVGNAIAIKISPYLEELSNQFLTWVKSGDTFGKIATNWIDSIIHKLDSVVNVLNTTKDAAKGLAYVLSPDALAIGSFRNIGKMVEDAKRLTDMSSGGSSTSGSIAKWFEDIDSKKEAEGRAQRFDDYVAKISKGRNETVKLADAMERIDNLNMFKLPEGYEEHFKNIGEFIRDMVDKTRSPLNKFTESIYKLEDALYLDKVDENMFNKIAAFLQGDFNKSITKASGNFGSSKQVDLSRTAISGINTKPTEIKSSQLNVTNKLLLDIKVAANRDLGKKFVLD